MAKGSANTVAAVSITCCAIAEWRNACTLIAILVAEPQSSLSGIRECPGWPIVPDNKKSARLWSHIFNAASVAVISKGGRFPAVHIANTRCPLRLQLRISKPMLPALSEAGNGREIGVTCTASSSRTGEWPTTSSSPLRSCRYIAIALIEHQRGGGRATGSNKSYFFSAK
jgi:hypothetical protein